MFYSDEDFAKKVNEKPGNVRFFKKCLRDNGLIGSRQQLADEHVPIFIEICQVREADNSTWELAINKVLEDRFGIDEEKARPRRKAVKGFISGSMEELENEINDFILQLDNGEVIDIKYSAVPTAIAAHTEYGVYPSADYTALVIYEKE